MLKLCDFGLALVLARGKTSTRRRGTVSHMAPEVHALSSDAGAGGSSGYTIAADVWSLGVVLYTLCSTNAEPPNIWSDKDASAPLEERVNTALDKLTTTSRRLLTMMRAMLVEDPQRRRTAKQLLVVMDTLTLDPTAVVPALLPAIQRGGRLVASQGVIAQVRHYMFGGPRPLVREAAGTTAQHHSAREQR